MNLKSNYLKRSLIIITALFLFLPLTGEAGELVVKTVASASNADPGESGASIASSALITVVATYKGIGVGDLGPTTGNGTSQITLPPGWSLNIAIVPPGGCTLSPTEFINQNDGVYSIRVVPYLSNPLCTWKLGDYHYVVTFEGKNSGMGLGILPIP